MNYRPAAPGDREELLRLWREAFSEDGSWFFRSVAAQGWCADDGDGLRAMAFAVNQWLVTATEQRPVAYVYAVATQREFRGKGLATALFQTMEDSLRRQGAAGMILVPATPGLFRLYEKMGYGIWACRPADTPGEEPGEPCSAAEYLALRQTYLTPPYVQPDESILRLYRLYRSDSGIHAVDAAGRTAERLPAVGGGVPFAMAKALTDDFPQKGYFAFAME